MRDVAQLELASAVGTVAGEDQDVSYLKVEENGSESNAVYVSEIGIVLLYAWLQTHVWHGCCICSGIEVIRNKERRERLRSFVVVLSPLPVQGLLKFMKHVVRGKI
jgi:hypothetical protein